MISNDNLSRGISKLGYSVKFPDRNVEKVYTLGNTFHGGVDH
jgi:hypothetical protein